MKIHALLAASAVTAENLMPLPDGGPSADFYSSWANYLSPMPHVFLSMAQWLGYWPAKWLYGIANGVLDAWNSAWNLMSFSQIFVNSNGSDTSNTDIIRLIPIFLTVGFVVLGIMMVVSLLRYELSGGRKGIEWPKGVAITFIVIGMLPYLLNGGIKVAQAVNDSILGNSTQETVLVSLWDKNSVDLTVAAKQNFVLGQNTVNKFSPFQAPNIKNSTSKKANFIYNSAFTSATSDDDALKGLSSNQSAVFKNKAGRNDDTVKLSSGFISVMDEVYPVIKVNWLGIIGAEFVFIFVAFMAVIELALRFYRLASYSIHLLYFGFRDISGKKSLQLLQLMEGSITGMALLPVGLIMFFGWIKFSMGTVNNMNLTWWPYTILSIAVLVAGGRGLMSGLAMIDEWTGVPSGSGSAMQSLSSAVMLANQGAALAGRLTGHKGNMGAESRKNAQDIADHAGGGKAGLLEKAAGAAGTIAGLGANAKDLPKAAVNAGVNKVGDKLNDLKNDARRGFQGGKGNVDNFASNSKGNNYLGHGAKVNSAAAKATSAGSTASSASSAASAAFAEGDNFAGQSYADIASSAAAEQTQAESEYQSLTGDVTSSDDVTADQPTDSSTPQESSNEQSFENNGGETFKPADFSQQSGNTDQFSNPAQSQDSHASSDSQTNSKTAKTNTGASNLNQATKQAGEGKQMEKSGGVSPSSLPKSNDKQSTSQTPAKTVQPYWPDSFDNMFDDNFYNDDNNK